MCLYPKLIFNPKYKRNNKNKGVIPQIKDPRVLWVPIGCKKCIECRTQKSNEWRVRLLEEIKTDKTGKFITFTIKPEIINEYYLNLKNVYGYEKDNIIASKLVRKFLENWRKTEKKSVKHWLITELGHGETEHLHIHGIIFSNKSELIKTKWIYGISWIGNYCNESTINYIIKYVTKSDEMHKNYIPKIFTSPGIDKNYIKTYNAQTNKFNETDTNESYITNYGAKITLLS